MAALLKDLSRRARSLSSYTQPISKEEFWAVEFDDEAKRKEFLVGKFRDWIQVSLISYLFQSYAIALTLPPNLLPMLKLKGKPLLR